MEVDMGPEDESQAMGEDEANEMDRRESKIRILSFSLP